MPSQRTVVIVGGTGNVGTECANRFGTTGFEVWQLSRRAPATSTDSSGRWRQCDATDTLSFRQILAEISEESGGIDVLVYTPALPPDVEVPLGVYPLDAWCGTWNIYVTGFLVAFQEALRLMEPHGHIVAIGSAITRLNENTLPPFHAGHYAAAKAALNELCKWGRREAHARGVLLSRVAPGALDVPYHRGAPEARRPKAMLPVPQLVDLILGAVNDEKELDIDIVAQANC